jgi:hypothetical protein
MASPDFSEYIDLTINDLQPPEIYAASRDYALISLPEFNPRVGTVEDAMLQAMSYVAGVVTGAVNRIPNGLMEGLLRVMGFVRSEATFASGNVILSAIDDTGLTIPAGTQVSFSEATADGVITHIFETTESVTIPEGSTDSAPTQIIAVEAGEKPILTDGTSLTLLSPVSRLFEVTFDGTMAQGAESESDEEFFNRATTFLAGLSKSLATSEQVTNYILNRYPNAFRVKTYDLTQLHKFIISDIQKVSDVEVNILPYETSPTTIYNSVVYTGTGASLVPETADSSPLGTLTPTAWDYIRVGDTSVSEYDGIWSIPLGIQEPSVGEYQLVYDNSPNTLTTLIQYPDQMPTIEFLDEVAYDADEALGCITIFVSNVAGGSLTAEDKAVIADDIRNKAIAGLRVFIADVINAPIQLNINVKVASGFSELQVRADVDADVTAFLSPEYFDFQDRVRKNAIISRVATLPGVEYVESVTITSSNTNIAYIDVDGNCIFRFKGTLPTSSVTVASI